MLLIIGPDNDVHANVVAQGLDVLRVKNVRWNASCSPLEQKMSLRLGDETEVMFSRDTQNWVASDVTGVWYRREGELTLPAGLNAENFPPFSREMVGSRRGVFALLSTAFWVNDWINAWQAENKVYQLACAKRLGFYIPQTLISNAPHDIRQFYRTCGGNVIHKMFYPANFNGGRSVACTNQLTQEDIEQTSSLEICPSIYQEKIDIEFEVRVCVFGETIFAAKLVNNKPTTDIRINNFQHVEATAFELPSQIAEQCRLLVCSMSLVSAAIDLAYTKTGFWVFFELNQSGQFLWIEKMVPDLPLLDAFCKFLACGNRTFRYQAGAVDLRFADFIK